MFEKFHKSSSPHRGTASRRLQRGTPILASLLLLLGLFFWGSACRGGDEPSSAPAYQVKAAFLYNFLKFTDWPTEGAASPTICLGVLGRDPFGDALESVRGKTAKGRRVVVAHFRRVEEVKECDLLFICDSERGRLPHIMKSVQGAHILTVADQEGFCDAGGIITLVSARGKVGFEVNIAAANRARLRISSQLLKLARKVYE